MQLYHETATKCLKLNTPIFCLFEVARYKFLVLLNFENRQFWHFHPQTLHPSPSYLNKINKRESNFSLCKNPVALKLVFPPIYSLFSNVAKTHSKKEYHEKLFFKAIFLKPIFEWKILVIGLGLNSDRATSNKIFY